MKNAVITGASTGIGRAVSTKMAEAGFRVYLIARRVDELTKTANLIHQQGGQAVVMPANLADPKEIRLLIRQLKESLGDVSMIANIAGIWHGADELYAGTDFAVFDPQVIVDTFMVGTVGPSLLVNGLLPLMKPGSKVINLSGTFENGGKGWLPYYVSKRALEDFTIGLSQELLDKKIQVNCISPSDTATASYARFFPEYMDEAVDPTVIAEEFVRLSDPADTTTGKIIVIKKDHRPFEHFHY